VPPTPATPSSTGEALTLDALMARQKQAAQMQGQAMQQPVANIPQGLAQMAWTVVNALQERRAGKELAQGQQDVAQAMSGLNYDTGELSPEAMQTLWQRDPASAMEMAKTAMTLRASKAKQENWVDLPAPEGSKEGVQWQQNTVTGEKRAVGGSGLTVNTGQPLPPEVAGKLGLAQGFLNDFDNVQKQVDAGNLTGLNYVGAVEFGRGTGGDAYRSIQSGVDALRRFLSGAGMNNAEVEEYVGRYTPTWHNDAATLHDKLTGLRSDLLNVQDAITQGRKWLPPGAKTDATTPAPDATPPAPAATPPAAPVSPRPAKPAAYTHLWPTEGQWRKMTPEQRQPFIDIANGKIEVTQEPQQ